MFGLESRTAMSGDVINTKLFVLMKEKEETVKLWTSEVAQGCKKV